jgi:hypothetical protein
MEPLLEHDHLDDGAIDVEMNTTHGSYCSINW